MSGKVRDYTRLAKDILEAVGGEENVIGASRCATRLRLVLKRSTPKAKDIVKSMPGVITMVMVAPTKHAIGLRSASGVELLAHIGLDTVTLDGTPFSLKVKEGDTVKKGEVLVEFDKAFIEEIEESALHQKIFTVVS
ncbi:PTS sugar transporter subunit IIA [Bacillus subtilis]|uniref:PTS sugar transporter subunit IIA n=1 Tax=Bacillus subtilis TaxID=1423 RepID=UPI0002C4E2EA|nr:PTS glucose transporter subunit IIA [Bacillus subtilis]AGI31172.1 putative phosphotransferase system enzyme IIA component [Bacillus subtilis subsp. subtilis str. BAB-1]AKD37229.1 putative phosphotransferase system enzyme IIA component [Bacillus subtilis HJ5]ASK26082.1 putative phosphotransferase system enzyme IIA component [Bacillus subtilis]MCL9627623.1 PTS glucose transporter subunit IIA [Bacillus subtilis]MED2946317.1 PTS glucose transporter subunit IIA [Bacillus subtilis]